MQPQMVVLWHRCEEAPLFLRVFVQVHIGAVSTLKTLSSRSYHANVQKYQLSNVVAIVKIVQSFQYSASNCAKLSLINS